MCFEMYKSHESVRQCTHDSYTFRCTGPYAFCINNTHVYVYVVEHSQESYNTYTWVLSRMKLRVIIQYVHCRYMSTVCMCVYIVEYIHGSCHVWSWQSCQRSWESCFDACRGYIWEASVLQCVVCVAVYCRTHTWVLSRNKLTVMSRHDSHMTLNSCKEIKVMCVSCMTDSREIDKCGYQSCKHTCTYTHIFYVHTHTL